MSGSTINIQTATDEELIANIDKISWWQEFFHYHFSENVLRAYLELDDFKDLIRALSIESMCKTQQHLTMDLIEANLHQMSLMHLLENDHLSDEQKVEVASMFDRYGEMIK